MPLWVVLVLAYLFEFANGWTDAPNSIATSVSTRVLRPHHAVIMAGVMNLVGALTGTAVAKTIAEGIVDPNYVTLTTIGAAVLAATVWALGAQYFGLPSSESHALVAALLGAGFAAGGLEALEWSGVQKSLRGLVISPVGGFIGGFALMILIFWIFSRVRRSIVGRVFGRAQIASAGFMAFSHGTNDAQKTMGIITLAILLDEAGPGGQVPTSFEIPLWVILSCSLVIGIGTMVGGWRVVRTIGLRMTKLEPVQGFAAETGAALVITGAARLGIPVSTTHAIGSSVMGVGATKRFSAVRWGVAGQVVSAWVLTWPSCMVMGYVFDKTLTVLTWGPALSSPPTPADIITGKPTECL
jgi:PiT family inorganic phosphate transporter